MGKGKKLMKKAKKSMKILKSGKILIEGANKIDLSPFIKTSVDEAVVSRLDGIISVEDANAKKVNCKIDHVLQSQVRVSELNGMTNQSPVNDTILIMLPKKASLTVFDFLDTGVVGDLLRCSTLANAYKQVKKKWVELNTDDNTEFTNILYLPDIMVFLDTKNNKFKEVPYKVNVLICAIPPTKRIAELHPTDEDTKQTARMRIISDCLEAGVRLGVKRLIIDPFMVKQLRKDRSDSAKLWNEAIRSERIRHSYTNIIMAFEDEGEFVVFAANK